MGFRYNSFIISDLTRVDFEPWIILQIKNPRHYLFLVNIVRSYFGKRLLTRIYKKVIRDTQLCFSNSVFLIGLLLQLDYIFSGNMSTIVILFI